MFGHLGTAQRFIVEHDSKTYWSQQSENQHMLTLVKENCIIKLYFYIKFKHKLFAILPICQKALKNVTPQINFKDV